MRPWLGKFLPIVLIAILAQVLAPIGTNWAASAALGDPLSASAICSDMAAMSPGQNDTSGQHTQHDSCCVLCCMAQACAADLDSRVPEIATPYRSPQMVVWVSRVADLVSVRLGTSARARAPPVLS